LYASCGESWRGEGRRRLGCEELVGVREVLVIAVVQLKDKLVEDCSERHKCVSLYVNALQNYLFL